MSERIYINPKNQLERIDAVWLVVSVDPETGNEGVCAAPLLGPGTLVPLIAADAARRDAIMEWATLIARDTGMTLRLIKFSTREEISRIEPNE